MKQEKKWKWSCPPLPVAKIVLEKLSPCEIDKHEGRKAEKPRRRKLKRSG